MSRAMLLVLLPFATISGGIARAQVNSAVTVTSVTVTKFGMGWQMVAKGNVTLGTNDAFGGVSFAFTDPNGKNVNSTIQNFMIPMPGQTQPYTVSAFTFLQGNWTFTVTEYYMTGMVPGMVSSPKKYTVP